MNIIKTTITQIRLFRLDELPIDKLVNQKYLQAFAKQFSFEKIKIGEDSPGELKVALENGLFQLDDGDDFVIKRVVIDKRKLISILECNSDISNQWFDLFRGSMVEISGDLREEYLDPVLVSEESEIVAEMDFSFLRIINPDFLSFIEEDTAKLIKSDLADISIFPQGLAFIVDFSLVDKEIGARKISLSDKEMLIAPQLGSLVEEKVIYTKVPVNTKKHIDLLEKLEKKME